MGLVTREVIIPSSEKVIGQMIKRGTISGTCITSPASKAQEVTATGMCAAASAPLIGSKTAFGVTAGLALGAGIGAGAGIDAALGSGGHPKLKQEYNKSNQQIVNSHAAAQDNLAKASANVQSQNS